jgi:probable phosphoglycerate mutase
MPSSSRPSRTAASCLPVEDPALSQITTFTFVRHGETDYNREQRFQGQVDVPLNATGLAQAARLARRLASEPADVLLCSDLLRTRQTAEPLARAWGLEAVATAGFREQSFGIVEGMTAADIERQHPVLWARWLQHEGDFALPGGESLLQFHQRVLTAVEQAASAHAGRHVAVIAHGGVLDMLWRSAHREVIRGLRRCDIPNTGINRLRWEGGRLEILLWGDAAHLAAAA